MKKSLVTCLVIIGLILAAPLSAQIYKYIDENGQKRWTDDLSQVPVEQRQSAEHFEDASDIPSEASATQGESGTVVTPETDLTDGNAELTRESLMKEKSELENQYKLLMEERKQIEQMKAEQGDTIHRAELNQRISAYNAKSDKYDIQLNAYKKKIDTYNNKIMPPNETQTQ
jgi:hypothetical protein